jgi:ribosomal protein S18 acetylase RimI-like enzyme
MLTIRPASIGDAAAIAKLYVETWRVTYPGLVPGAVLVGMSAQAQLKHWTAALARLQPQETVLVAEREGRGIIGFGSCGAARQTILPHAGEIYTLYVAPSHQEQGAGRALMQGLFTALAESGLTSAVVWVLAGNPSRFFYEALGGRRIAERSERLWGTLLDQVAYGWDDVRVTPRRRGVRMG